MIDPHHICHFTRTGRTELSIWEDENRLVSAGVSPRVLLSALAKPELLWFSKVYGDLDDNLDILAVQDTEVAPDQLEVYPETGRSPGSSVIFSR